MLCFALLARGSWWFVAGLLPVAVVLRFVASSEGSAPEPGRPARAAIRWVGGWPVAGSLTGPQLWSVDAPRGVAAVGLAVVVFVVVSVLWAWLAPSIFASVAPEGPLPPAHRPGHELSWSRRREIARAVRAGRTAPGATEADVRAVIDRMLYWEIVAWVAALVAFTLTAFAVAAAAQEDPVLVPTAGAVLSTLVAVVVQRRTAATKRHLRDLDARRAR